MVAFCSALLVAAVNRLDAGLSYFASDDVPETKYPDKKDSAVVGAVTSQLIRAGTIQQFYGNIPSEKIFGGRRMSKRGTRNGSKIGIYQLTNRGMAVEWLKRNGVSTEPVQTSLF